MATTTEEEVKSAPEKKQKSYFTKNVVNRYVLDDGESYIEHQKLDEGLFQSYQDITSRIRLGRDDSTEVDMALGKQRRFLIENLVVNWNLLGEDDKPIRFVVGKVFDLPPDLVSGLIADIYDKNKILSGEDSESGKADKKT